MNAPRDEIAASIVRARAELDQALAGLRQLPAFETGTVALVAHALINYLTVSNGTIELLLRDLSTLSEAQLRSRLDTLQEANDLMTRAVARLMNTAPEDGPTLVVGDVDLVAVAQLARDYYQHVADNKRITIAFESSTASATVRTVRVAIAAVLDNLLSNAVKFSPPGRRVWVRVRAEPGSVVCTVQDEGPGLSHEDQAKLFQQGVRLSAVPTGGEPSFGYGLAVAKSLVDRLGGELWCESELGAGALFGVRLPLEPPQAEE